MNLTIENNGRRLTFDDDGENKAQIWATFELLAGDLSTRTMAIRLDLEDAERIAGFIEAWLIEQEKVKE